jgi:hypothetical protein
MKPGCGGLGPTFSNGRGRRFRDGPGKRIRRCKLLQKLGEGGISVVLWCEKEEAARVFQADRLGSLSIVMFGRGARGGALGRTTACARQQTNPRHQSGGRYPHAVRNRVRRCDGS